MFYWRWFNRPRHPVARVLLGLLGAVLLVGVLTLGFFALIAFAAFSLIVAVMRAFTHPLPARSGSAEPSNPNVIEGEYVVLRHSVSSVER